MKYIVSQWGAGLSIGMLGRPEEVEEDRNIAHNLYGVNFIDDVYNGRMNFGGMFKFYRFLIYKHAIPFMNKHQCSLREAMSKTREEFKKYEIVKNNFMFQLGRVHRAYKIGYYDDGDYGYYYED